MPQDIGKESVKHVENCMDEYFEGILSGEEVTHILNDVEWYESIDPNYVYPVLIVEPILEETPNNLVCICNPFDKTKFL
jgi:hypothetical protein